MSTWLVESEYSLAFFVVLVLLLLAPWLSRQYARYGRLTGWPGLLSAGTVAYVCALVAFTLFPVPQLSPEVCATQVPGQHLRLVPLQSFAGAWAEFGRIGPVASLTSFATLQIVFNVVFFVPLGFLLGHRWRKSLAATLLIGFGVSLLIEATQGSAVWGLFPCPYRVAEVDDLITNTTGAAVGWLIALVLRDRLPDPDPPAVVDVASPGLIRRAGAVLIDVLVIFEIVIISALIALGVLLALDAAGIQDLGAAELAVDAVQLTVLGLLLVVVPSRRADRGTPGTAAVHLALSTNDGSPARLHQLLIRALLRYLPLLIIGLPWMAFGLLDLLVALLRADRRTLTDLASRTVSVTRTSQRARRQSG